MNWSSLYSARRTGDPANKSTNPDQVRTSFLRDYDRIIFSSAFRRLQNKTQVFPLPGAVFVHNRLTHSLEVASVGRSLGKTVGEAIAAKYPDASRDFNDFYRHELQSVIAAACLAHDIGNPPFGHSGEDAIRNFFTSLTGTDKATIHQHLSENQRKDFEFFEGNSNAFRLLTHRFNEKEPSNKLTLTTLAAIVKYPCISAEGFNKHAPYIANKKSGFFDSEIDTYLQIVEQFEIPKKEDFAHVYARHPFVYLTEAADDICYRVIDLEDAHRLHLITLETFLDLFLPFFEREEGYYNTREYIDKKLAEINDDNQKVQFIRAKWIGLMVNKLATIFLDHETQLLAGTLDADLMKCLDDHDRALIDRINAFSIKYIYNYRSVVEIEIAGYNVIGGLLEEFVHAVLQPSGPRSAKILKLIPAQFPISKEAALYHNLQSVVDFISGMTDLYAIDLYRKITGINIPEIR